VDQGLHDQLYSDVTSPPHEQAVGFEISFKLKLIYTLAVGSGPTLIQAQGPKAQKYGSCRLPDHLQQLVRYSVLVVSFLRSN
jgi:hypothetical protein